MEIIRFFAAMALMAIYLVVALWWVAKTPTRN